MGRVPGIPCGAGASPALQETCGIALSGLRPIGLISATRRSGRLTGPGRGHGAGQLAEALEALPKRGSEPVEPIRLDREFQLVIEAIAAEPPFDHGHRERPPAGAGDRLECPPRAERDDLARDHLAAGLLAN